LVSHGRIAKSQRANILLTTAIQNVYKTNQDFGNDTMSLPGVGNRRVFCPLGERGFLISTAAWWYRKKEWIVSRELVNWVGSRS
jgi:hypothetical protein